LNLAIAATCFGIVFVAELPDKTALASLMLGARYRGGYVFAGVAVAFTLHVVLAVSAGSLLLLLPHRVVEAVVAVLFTVGAVLMPRRRDDDILAAAGDGSPATSRDRFWPVAARSFAVLFVAEFGDLTQLVTANLAARYHGPVAVGAGAVLGLWAVGALAITGGRQLLRVVPFRWITRAAAAVMLVLAVVSLVTALTG
jgi:putative Ca2+/H+ antiporter (TMEM165/GDT1 family)